MKQSLRIIAGKFRGKKFVFPEVDGLRPTPDRVRETLFNWLMKNIQDARCLDAFAGSGALGLEAFSRGAQKVSFIEQAPAAHSQLQKNLRDFCSPNLTLFKMDACDFLAKTGEQFDIIFLDPPFAKNLLPSCLKLISERNILAPEGLVYIESGTEPVLDSTIWNILHLKKAGQVYYGLIELLTLSLS